MKNHNTEIAQRADINRGTFISITRYCRPFRGDLRKKSLNKLQIIWVQENLPLDLWLENYTYCKKNPSVSHLILLNNSHLLDLLLEKSDRKRLNALLFISKMQQEKN